MRVFGFYAHKVTLVFLVPKEAQHFVTHSKILFLKYFRPSAFVGFAACLVDAILLYGINEKQAQHLNTLLVELVFAFEVLLYGGANLYAAHGLFGYRANGLPLVHLLSAA